MEGPHEEVPCLIVPKELSEQPVDKSSYVHVFNLVIKTMSIMDRYVDAVGRKCEDVDPAAVLGDVENLLRELNELFSDPDEGPRSNIISVISSDPNVLQVYYRFADQLYEGEYLVPSPGAPPHCLNCTADAPDMFKNFSGRSTCFPLLSLYDKILL